MKYLLLALLLLLGACSFSPAKIAPPEDQAVARAAVSDLAAGRADALMARMIPQLRPAVGQNLPRMQAMLPVGRLRLIQAGVTTNFGNGARQTSMIWEATDGRRYALVSTIVVHAGPAAQLTELYLLPIDRSADELSRFDLRGKSFLHYLFLLLTFASFAACLAGFVLALRTKAMKYRWLWAIGSLVAVGQVSIRWSDGDVFFKLLNVQLLGGFALKTALLTPWQVGFGIPVVAIGVMIRRRQLRRTRDEKDRLTFS